MRKNKRGVSVMIEYILLITFAVVIAGLVYQWLKSYVPQQGIECPDGVSIYVSDYNIDQNTLNLIIKNNGKFNIGGLFMYYTDNSDQELATNDLSALTLSGGTKMSPGIKFIGEGDNSFGPNSEDLTLSFDITGIETIYDIEITPIRWQENKNKIQTVSCTNAKTKKVIDYPNVLTPPQDNAEPKVQDSSSSSSDTTSTQSGTGMSATI